MNRMEKIIHTIGEDVIAKEMLKWPVERLDREDKHPFEVVLDMYTDRFGEDSLSKL